MRFRVLPAALALMAAVPCVVRAQAQFQGTVVIRMMQENGSAQVLKYSVRDGVARYDMNGNNAESAVMILDQAAGKMLFLIPTQHMYMEQPMDVSGTPKGAAPAKHGSVKATGRKETIAGYECEHMIVQDDASKPVDVCVTHALGNFMSRPSRRGSMGGGGVPGEEWSSQLGPNAFPLRVTESNRVMFEVVSVKRERLDAALFAPPAGWQRMDMSGMGHPQRP